MTTVNIRKQGGAAIVTIPAKPRRCTLKELLRGATPKNMKALNRQTAHARAGKAVGRELA